MAHYRAGQSVLIIAQDPMLAALVGCLVETARLEPAFARDGEPPDEAIRRVRPVLLLLLDIEEPAAVTDLVLARARRADIPVALFGPHQAIVAQSAWIRERNLRAFSLPEDIQRFIETLNHLRRGERLRRAGDRRASPQPERVFRDPTGTRWAVYDRRGNDRRAVDRNFVSENGERRHCVLSDEEARQQSDAALAAQLARARELSR